MWKGRSQGGSSLSCSLKQAVVQISVQDTVQAVCVCVCAEILMPVHRFAHIFLEQIYILLQSMSELFFTTSLIKLIIYSSFKNVSDSTPKCHVLGRLKMLFKSCILKKWFQNTNITAKDQTSRQARGVSVCSQSLSIM